MIAVDEVFAVLLVDARKETADSRLYLHPAGVRTPAGEVALAADLDGHRHLLVPMAAHDHIESQPGRSLTWTEKSLSDRGTTQRYADLACLDAGLTKVFSDLVRDALERVENDPGRALSRVEQALAEWRRLLAQSRPMSEESARGLYGELVVLERLSKLDPVRAVTCWSGPDQQAQDFRTAYGAVEVKTSTRDDLSVKISSLEQLDSYGLPFLLLAYVRVEEGAPHTDSLDAIIDRLLKGGAPELELLEKCASYGHVYLGGVNDGFRFGIVDLRFWIVSERFPGLRSSDIPLERRDAISALSYRLSLVGAPGELTSDDVHDRMKELLGVQ